MSSFSQWRAAFKKNPVPKKITWVCGPERILVDEVVETLRASLTLDPWNTTVLSAGTDSERTVWNDIRQHPMGLKGDRLTIVLHAQRLGNDQAFLDYIRDRGLFPRNHVIFVSDETEFRRIPSPDGKGKGELWEPLAYLRNKGDQIECRPFTQATASKAVTWVQDRAKITPNVAAHLLNRADGNLRLVRDVINKLAVFADPITLTTINEMLAQEPQDSFVNALFALDKKTALLAMERMPKEEWGKALGQIDARLDLAGLVHDMMVERRSPGEIAAAAGNKNFLVKDIMPVAKHYDVGRRQKIRSLLALIDEYAPAYQNGTLETVVAFW